ncbi:ubiquitin-activating enzyme E1 [Haematococcus lacustris]
MSKRASSDAEDQTEKKLRMNGDKSSKMVIDEDLHSRQLAVYGREAMKRMASSAVLISGANGLGVEIAKNAILAGLRSVVIHDKKAVQLSDLSAQFYLTPEDIGKNRAEACKDKLQELNTAVAVKASTTDLTDEFLKLFEVVVLTDSSLEEAKRVDNFCHASGISFIWAKTHGVFSAVFTDFGPSFTVIDVNGEEPLTGIVASITSGTVPLVTCVEDERLQFQDGQTVTFSEVEGMTQLNNHRPIKVKNCKAHSFELDLDTSGFEEYQRGGIVVQCKEPKTLKFSPLTEALQQPGEFLMSDFAKFDRPPTLYVGFQAMEAFQAEHGRPPRPADASDAEQVLQLAKSINAALPESVRGELGEGVLRALAHCGGAELNPMAAMLGGVVGQEVVKAISGKFHPIHQWFYFDSMESLPELDKLPAEEFAPLGSRYDAQVGVFGRSLQVKLAGLKLFLVGAGALGCEFIKNFAMMGIACPDAGAEGGSVTVTDDDTIEKSNLSRQFLFRDWDIGSAKSTVAARATQRLNPSITINALQNRVSPDTEAAFNDAFWQGLDLVVNALDNVNARLYVDSRCVYFGKPLLESGTLGPKCNTQVVIPRLTENYGASRDPPEKQAPMCTLHSFPHNIDHCLTWARSEFEGLLEKAPSEANAYLADPAKYAAAAKHAGDASAREQLEKVVAMLVSDRASSFDQCITWARTRFQDYFHNKIAQLTYTFPEDATTSSGTAFWSAPKRFPRALNFDPSDPSHVAFVQAGAILWAEVFGIPRPEWASDPAKVAAAAAAVPIPAFVPKKGVRIETDPKAKTEPPPPSMDDEGVISGLLSQLEEALPTMQQGYKLQAIQFEKDDDTNYHMDFIAGLANMRARNYSVPEVDKLKAKLIAGRIIPAIATATACATGLVCLELYKAVQAKPLEAYRNTFANLALPIIAMAEPVAPKTIKFNDLSWTLWDRWILEGDLTVQQVLDWFSQRALRAYSISCGAALMYNDIFPRHKERLGKKMSELVVSVAKQQVPAWRSHFDVVVACEDEEGEDLDVPLVSIKFR